MTQRCQSCGGQVSDRYARVRGDNRNRVTECPHCNPGGTYLPIKPLPES